MNKLDTKKLNELSSELEELNLKKDLGEVADIVYELIEVLGKIEIKDGKTPIKGVDYFDGKNTETKIIETIIERVPIITNEIKEVAVADTPEVIREKLESLEDEEKLPIKAIYKLQEELDKLKKHIDSKVVYVGGGGVGKHNVVAHDLSDSLSADGSVRSFNLPAFWKIVSVHLSSFPNILRPNIDYTVSGSTITFTSEIPDVSIALPNTCIVLLSE